MAVGAGVAALCDGGLWKVSAGLEMCAGWCEEDAFEEGVGEAALCHSD